MKPLNYLLVIPAALLVGCTSVTTSRQASQMLTLLGENPAADANIKRALDEKPYGVHNLATQVLGLSSENKARALAASPVRYSIEEVAPIPAGLERNSVVKKLVKNQVAGGEVTFKVGELKGFAEEFLTKMDDPYQPQQYGILARAQSRSELAFGNILLGYFMAYKDGSFVLRDGTTLGKPKASFKIVDGKFTGSVDNDTITGLLTVFSEAMYDYGLATPIYYQLNSGKQTWEESYKETPAGSNEYIKIFKKITGPDTKDYLVGGKTPTAAAFLETRKLVAAYTDKSPAESRDLTLKEFQFIRFSASLAADRSKDLSGLIMRSLGSIDAGMFILGSFSVGNNETLAKVVETGLSCLSGRITEYGLAKAFGKYRGDKAAVNEILDHYKAIYDEINKLGN